MESKIKTVQEAKTPSALPLISGYGQLLSTREQIHSFLERAGLSGCHQQYFVVGIMGCQSSGKSTLLNMLFGTEFEELDSTVGRQMTTKGVWLGASPKVENVLVMDLEGTDSVTRGVERHPFERQSALFALSVAELLVINMWQHDIGRYVASNYGVLSTVFEVNLELMASDIRDRGRPTKTTLLFTIRDHNEQESPLSVIAGQLERDIDRIWGEISLPSGLEHLKPVDLFEVKFCGLPHKRYESELFEKGVAQLREKMTDPAHPEYFFTGPDHCAKSVPIDGFDVYVQTIWNVIQSHKDLDLPTQKEMLAIYRCDELAQEVLSTWPETIAPLRKQVEVKFHDAFCADAEAVLDGALDAFKETSAGYHDGTVDRKRLELRDRLLEELRPLFVMQMNHARTTCFDSFRRALAGELKKFDNVACDCFKVLVKQTRQSTVEMLRNAHKNCLVEGATWTCDDSVRHLDSDIVSHVDTVRKAQLKLLVDECRRQFKNSLLPEVNAALNAPQADMWKTISDALNRVKLEKVDPILDEKLPSFHPDDGEETALRNEVSAGARKLIFDEVKHHVGYLKMKVHKAFDQQFRLDEHGLPRIWHQQKHIRRLLVKARDHANNVVELFREFKLGADGDSKDSNVVLLTDREVDQLKTQLNSDFEQALAGAEAAAERANALAKTPMWVFPLVAVLGFNEFIAIVSNPWLMVLIVIFVATGAMLHALHLSGPFLKLVRIAIQQGTTLLADVLTNTSASAIAPSPSEASARAPLVAPFSRYQSAESLNRSDDEADQENREPAIAEDREENFDSGLEMSQLRLRSKARDEQK